VRSFRNVILGISLVLGCAAGARAQGLSVLNPLAPTYPMLSFTFESPKGDGWRELGAAPDSVRLIYAEQLAEGQINARADFNAQAFEISTTEKVQLPDLFTLTRMSMAQRQKEKKDEGSEVVAMSPPEQLDALLPMYGYTLVVKTGELEVFEHYFVVLAPNKAEYLSAKLVTKEKDFREQAYFKGIESSMKTLKFGGAAAGTPDPAATPAEPAKNADGASATPDSDSGKPTNADSESVKP
jgi:hypothetical protein